MRNLKLVRFLVFWLRYFWSQLIETTLSSKKNEALQAVEQKKDLSLSLYILILTYIL